MKLNTNRLGRWTSLFRAAEGTGSVPKRVAWVRLGLRAPCTSRDQEETGMGFCGRFRSRRGEHARTPVPIPLARHPLVLAV